MVTGEMDSDSDIDFYIVTAEKRLFTARLLAVGLVHFTGWRRYGKKIRGRICLNRFATLKALTITPCNDYHARVFSALAPLYAQQAVYRDYYEANQWMDRCGYQRVIYPTIRLTPNGAQFIRRIGEWWLGGRVGDWLETRLSHWQQHRIAVDPRTQESQGRVRVSSDELCLHPLK